PHPDTVPADIRRYRIRMRPGKPFAYGFIRGRPIFCLPGNPVSVYVSFLQFVRPVLLRLQGRPPEEPPEATGTMGADFACAEDRVFFVTARVAETPGGPELFPTGPQSSGDLFSLVSAQGLIRVEPGTATLKRGDRVRFIPLA
nr:hypothetical protein [bacterium]